MRDFILAKLFGGSGGVATVNGVTPDENGNVEVEAGGVGKSLAGMSVSVSKGKMATAGTGAEIFNDYRERQYYVSGLPSSGNIASGEYSHAEGKITTASGYNSHAEGSGTKASGTNSHAEGDTTTASGNASHAEGESTQALAYISHAEGLGTIAASNYQHVQGQYNIKDSSSKYAHIVGNGGMSARSNAHTLDWSGNAWYAGTVESVGVVIPSSTEGSTKRFLITVDDSGVLTATEVTE